jgi:hypothetical protein
VILIHPPVSKPSEPPPGIARLAGALRGRGIGVTPLDINLEGILHLLAQAPPNASDTWTTRARRHLASHLQALQRPEGYANLDRYRRAVLDINRVLDKAATPGPAHVSLANFSDDTLSPLRSSDLIVVAERPERNPFYPYFKARLTELLEGQNPRAIGFSLNYLSQALCTFSMIGFLKRERPGLRIVLGGGLVTSWMRRPGWKNPFAGLVEDLVAGPGEDFLLSIYGVEPDPGAPVPDYGAFLDHEYLAPGFILPFSASTGCYWHRCSFCPERAEGNPYCSIPPEAVIGQVRTLAEKTRPVLVHFLDNALSPALLEGITRGDPLPPWYGFARITPHLADPEFCVALKRSGCAMLKLGIESGDQGVLDRLQKGVDLGTASKTLKNLRDAGIGTYVYLLFGTPEEDEASARRTLDFAVTHGEHIDFLNLAIFNMPTYGPDAEKFGIRPFYEGDLSLYTAFDHPLGWNRVRVRAFLTREFKRHPVIASILRRDPPLFTSNHAPFLATKHHQEIVP